MKHLVIAEKPSVGRDIARVLQCSDKQQGFISGEDYIVTWAIGHLVTNCLPEDIDPSLKTWKLDTLPTLKAFQSRRCHTVDTPPKDPW